MVDGPETLPGRAVLHCGDCLVVLPGIASGSVDAVVTDPPYGLEFMGKEWDGSDGFRRSLNAADTGRDSMFGRQSARGPEYRTAGVGQKGAPGIGARDTEWVSNQGWNQFRCETCSHLFHGGSPCQCAEPKPVRADNRWNLFQTWCEAWARECLRILKPGGYLAAFGGTRTYHRLACGIEDAGFEIRDQAAWAYGTGFNKVGYIRDRDGEIAQDGWGGSLKPAWEPIALARKPLIGTVAENMAKHGTGALNIDGCRIPSDGGTAREGEASQDRRYGERGSTNFAAKPGPRGGAPEGRWPANLWHDGSDEVVAAFPDAPGQQRALNGGEASKAEIYGKLGPKLAHTPRGDSGSAARFFYAAKADADDRIGSKHPTVKPIDLMQYAVRLVTPKGGTILDPFAGTGTVGEAAFREGMQSVLIERDPEYQGDIRRRMALILAGPQERAREIAKVSSKATDHGPLFAEVTHAD